VDEFRLVGEEESRRRAAVERTLREAVALFKKELWDKGEELAELQGRLRAVSRQQLVRMCAEENEQYN